MGYAFGVPSCSTGNAARARHVTGQQQAALSAAMYTATACTSPYLLTVQPTSGAAGPSVYLSQPAGMCSTPAAVAAGAHHVIMCTTRIHANIPTRSPAHLLLNQADTHGSPACITRKQLSCHAHVNCSQ